MQPATERHDIDHHPFPVGGCGRQILFNDFAIDAGRPFQVALEIMLGCHRGLPMRPRVLGNLDPERSRPPSDIILHGGPL